MSLFDTIVFPEAITCARCGASVMSTQTYELGETLDTYRVGDMADAGALSTGVIEERLFCGKCRNFEERIYVTLWHGLITGIYRDQDEAERNLLAVDRADILYWLAEHQREERRVRGLLREVLGTVERYAEHLASQEKGIEPSGFYAAFTLRHLKEHLDADDPLKSIVQAFRERLGPSGEADGLSS